MIRRARVEDLPEPLGIINRAYYAHLGYTEVARQFGPRWGSTAPFTLARMRMETPTPPSEPGRGPDFILADYQNLTGALVSETGMRDRVCLDAHLLAPAFGP